MIASARVAYLARRADEYGVRTDGVRVDLSGVRERKRQIVASFRDSNRRGLEKTPNLDVIFGAASFAGPKSLDVQLDDGSHRTIGADRVFINAGSRPAQPALSGLPQVPFLDSTSIMELDAVPDHLLVLGGGYVGLEFAQMFRRFGSRVTIVQSSAQLLGREDEDVARAVTDVMREDGIEVLLGARAECVATKADRIQLTVSSGDAVRSVEGSHLLVATGRVPNSDSLNLSAAGIAADERGFIRVNERLETTCADVFALGDINGGPAFTHIAYDDFRIVRENVLENGRASTAGRLVPYTVFIDPQLGRVGATEAEARSAGHAVKIAKMPMTKVARAVEVAEPRGFIKAVVDASTDRILGAAVLSIEGGEVMSMLQVAMMGNLPYAALRDAVFAHPTLAESLNNLFTHFDS
jgi:pyruvate/2-oxoglutarate dehydrogenase complex dihydrolipoamide dehydrogenase (E3) component